MMTNNVKMILGIGLLGTAAYLIYDGMKKKSKSSFTGPAGKRFKNGAGVAGFETTLEEEIFEEGKKISECYSDGEDSATPGYKRCCRPPYICKAEKVKGKCADKPKVQYKMGSDYGGYDSGYYGGYDSYNGPKVELGAETLNCPRGTTPVRGKDGNIYCMPNNSGGYSSGYGAYSPKSGY